MEVLQNVARRYGLVCLLHEKPFAGVNGSGKHNNWSMGTDTRREPARPGRHAAREPAVPVLLRRRHPGRQQAPGAAARVDRRPRARTTASAPTRRRRRSSRSSSAPSSRRSSTRSRRGEVGESTPESFLGLGTPVLPPLPMHGGDRNRTSPFAFTGNKFEFRALGSSMSPSFPNTVLNTIVAEAIDELVRGARGRAAKGVVTLEEARARRSSAELRRQQADRVRRRQLLRGVARGGRAARPAQPPATPDALPYIIDDATSTLFSNYGVLSERELESRYEVLLEQYVTKINIEAETAAAIARTMLLPAAARHLALMLQAQLPELASETEALDLGARRRAPRARERRTWRRTSPMATRSCTARYKLRHRDPGDGGDPRGGRQAGEGRRRRPLAAAEVLGDPVHPLTESQHRRSQDGPRTLGPPVYRRRRSLNR